MHDDIMDKDVTRRGSPTIHKQYEKDLEKLGAADPYHFGISMGIDMGDLGSYLAMEVLLEAKIPAERKIKAAGYLSRLLQRVAYGQALDVLYEKKKKVTEADVMEVHLQKTSVYTIGGPLKVGALLGGLTGARIDAIEKFGEPVGIAFQLRDDELGLYSDEGTLGKPIGGDIREGKNTILKIKAIELAKGEDKKFLTWAYGNKDIKPKDVEKVKEITIRCGALKYSQDLSKNLVEKGKKFIPRITKDDKMRDLLSKAADFVITRNS
jgi:geranylgeranyl diphosphate synthase type I